MSTINAKKLAALGYAKMRQACFAHALKAITYKRAGNERLFNRHCELLDQCGQVGRTLKALKPERKGVAL